MTPFILLREKSCRDGTKRLHLTQLTVEIDELILKSDHYTKNKSRDDYGNDAKDNRIKHEAVDEMPVAFA